MPAVASDAEEQAAGGFSPARFLSSNQFREQCSSAEVDEDEVTGPPRPPARATALRTCVTGQEEQTEAGGRALYASAREVSAREDRDRRRDGAHGRLRRPRPPVRGRQRQERAERHERDARRLG